MLSVKCPNCELTNKASHTHCVRCYSPLQGEPSFELVQDSPNVGVSKKIKLIVGGAVLLFVVVAGGILISYLGGDRNTTSRYAAFEAAIRGSDEFNAPITVEAGRYTFHNRDESRVDQEATPAAYALDNLGLLYIHTSLHSDVPTRHNSEGKQIIDPETGLVPFQYNHVNLELTQSGQTQSASWEPYEVKRDGKVGWKVPLGERQLVRVVEVMPTPEGQPLEDGVLVSFTWKWKPNEIGQSFDKRSETYVKPDKPKNFPRSSFEVEVNDSQAVYWGTADLHRVNGKWETTRFTWIGQQGVRLSPNASDEIDKIVKDSQTPR